MAITIAFDFIGRPPRRVCTFTRARVYRAPLFFRTRSGHSFSWHRHIARNRTHLPRTLFVKRTSDCSCIVIRRRPDQPHRMTEATAERFFRDTLSDFRDPRGGISEISATRSYAIVSHVSVFLHETRIIHRTPKNGISRSDGIDIDRNRVR